MNESVPRLYKGLISDKKVDNLCISICDFKMEESCSTDAHKKQRINRLSNISVWLSLVFFILGAVLLFVMLSLKGSQADLAGTITTLLVMLVFSFFIPISLSLAGLFRKN